VAVVLLLEQAARPTEPVKRAIRNPDCITRSMKDLLGKLGERVRRVARFEGGYALPAAAVAVIFVANYDLKREQCAARELHRSGRGRDA